MNEERFSTRPDAEEKEERTVRDRLEGVLGFLRGEKTESDGDSENSEKRKKGKSKKWRSFMRRLFGGEQTTEDEDKPRSLFAPIISYEPLPTEPHSGTASEQPVEQEEALPHGDGVVDVEPAEITSTDMSREQSTDEAASEILVPENDAAELPQEPEVEQGVLHIDHDRAGDYERFAQQQDVSPPAEAPPIIVKNATPALLAVDYLNHRARKKLEKRFEKDKVKQDEEIKNLKKRHASSTERTPISRPVTSEALKAPAPDKKPVIPAAESAPQRESRAQAEEKQSNPEVVATPEAIEVETRGAHSDYEQTRARAEQAAAYQEVQAAVDEQEHLNNFVEREYERRHEVRDEAGTDAVSVAEILKTKQLKKVKADTSIQSTPQSLGAVEPSKTPADSAALQATSTDMPVNQQSVSYNSAIASGFIAGMVIFASLIALTILR